MIINLTMNTEELLQRYAAGERDFSGIVIWDANLVKANLRGINLSHADLSGACLIAADLSEANLDQIRLEGSDLTSAILRQSSLKGAGLEGCQLVNTNCREVNMTEAKLWDSCIDGALFYRANLYRAKLVVSSRYGTDFGDADMRETMCECGKSAAFFERSNLLHASGFVPQKTDTLIETIMPDGTIKDDRPLIRS